MTFDEYMASDRKAEKYFQMSQWQRLRHFLDDRRFFRARGQRLRYVVVPIFVLDLTLDLRTWAFGFVQYQMDYRFCLGPLMLIWAYE